MEKRYILSVLAVIMFLCFAGCTKEMKQVNQKVKDIQFTVIGEDNLPEELKQIIDEKKQNEFKITYQDDDFLYICVGYGKQDAGGYSITVHDLYLTGNAIYADTNLVGPGQDHRDLYHTKENSSASFPYIVIKTEYLDMSVVFD